MSRVDQLKGRNFALVLNSARYCTLVLQQDKLLYIYIKKTHTHSTDVICNFLHTHTLGHAISLSKVLMVIHARRMGNLKE